MIKMTSLIAVVILALGMFGLFQVKFYVRNLRGDIAEMEKQFAMEKEALYVLKAEWTYLNQPERLSKLAKKHLNLAPVRVAQLYKMEGKLPLYLAEDNAKRELYLASIEFAKENSKVRANQAYNNMVKAAKYRREANKTSPVKKIGY